MLGESRHVHHPIVEPGDSAVQCRAAQTDKDTVLLQFLFIAFFATAIAMNGWITWTNEQQIRTWPDDNWISPTSRSGAAALIILTPLMYLAGAAWTLPAAFGQFRDEGFEQRFLLAMAPSVVLVPVVGLLLWRTVRSAPHNANKLRPPFTDMQSTSDRAELSYTVMAGWQSFRIQRDAAELLGWSPHLVHAVRLATMATFLTSMALTLRNFG